MDHPDDGSGGRPEVRRGELRRILLASLPADTVRWRRKLTAVAALAGGRRRLSFADGASEQADLLVGADGAWSRVRPLLSAARPTFTGLAFIETFLYASDARHPASVAAVGGGALMAVAPGKGILAHREPDGVLHAYVTLSRPEAWIAALEVSERAVLARIAREFEGWAPALTALLTDGEGVPVVRPLYALPVGHRWDRVPGRHLARRCGAPDATLGGRRQPGHARRRATRHGPRRWRRGRSGTADLRTDLFQRSTAAAVDAQGVVEALFGDRAPQSLLDFFATHRAGTAVFDLSPGRE